MTRWWPTLAETANAIRDELVRGEEDAALRTLFDGVNQLPDAATAGKLTDALSEPPKHRTTPLGHTTRSRRPLSTPHHGRAGAPLDVQRALGHVLVAGASECLEGIQRSGAFPRSTTPRRHLHGRTGVQRRMSQTPACSPATSCSNSCRRSGSC